MKITITPISTGYAIRFPKELNSEFRSVFRSAVYNPNTRQWEVGPRTGKRLEQWASVAEAAAKAASDVEDLDLTEAELSDVRLALAKKAKEIELSRSNIKQLSELKATLAAEKRELEIVQRDLDTTKKQEAAIAADVKQMLAGLIDFNELTALKHEMSRNHNPANRMAKDKFEAARLKVKKIRDDLAAAGWRSEGISAIASANINRPDRDSVAGISDETILRISKIEE